MLANKFKYIFTIKFISLIIGLIIFIGLNFFAPNPNEISSNNIVFILDISHSMNTADISSLQGNNISRLSLAKKIMNQTISDYPDKSFGLILFAGNADYYIPPTSDHESLLDHISALDTGILPQGGSNIYQGIKTFVETEKSSTGILISDFGDENDLSTQKDNISKISLSTDRVILVGLGSDKGDYVKYPNGEFIKKNGEVVSSRFNKDFADKIANKFNTNLIRFDNEKKLSINISTDGNQIIYIKPSQKIYLEFAGILFILASL